MDHINANYLKVDKVHINKHNVMFLKDFIINAISISIQFKDKATYNVFIIQQEVL